MANAVAGVVHLATQRRGGLELFNFGGGLVTRYGPDGVEFILPDGTVMTAEEGHEEGVRAVAKRLCGD